ncbi:MAG TPA: hypothetical protein VFH73_28880 [Polyangia bacterium]|jgi:hypothetical protein|nr:hypothetical protein [Polyangia bacterium]
MPLDPTATRILLMVGAMCVLVLFVFLMKRSSPETPQIELILYEGEAWRESLLPGEKLEAQATVIQPPTWWDTLLSSNLGRGHPTPYQLALSSGRALLVARRARELLTDRDRHPLNLVSVTGVEEDGPLFLTVDLRLSGKAWRFVKVPRPFVDLLRAATAPAATSGGG